MTSDTAPVALRAFPFRSGCAAMGCVVMFLCFIGLGSAYAMPLGWIKIQHGAGLDFVMGIGITLLCALGLCALLLAPVMLYQAVQEARRPQTLFVTTLGLQLPPRLVTPQFDEKGRLIPDAPPRQPQVIPFSTIRRIVREDGNGGGQLSITHDLRTEPLIVAQFMMTGTDFEEFAKLLRELIPDAFTPPPPVPPAA